jgi:hypothetical protein
MYDIDETNAPVEDFTTKVKGVDVLDVMWGGVGSNHNAAAEKLALRTANLNQRLVDVEAKLGVDGDAIINTLADVVQAFEGIAEGPHKLADLLINVNIDVQTRAKSDASNLTSTNVGQWKTALNVGNKVVRSGNVAITAINAGNNFYTVYLASVIPNFNPALHSILVSLSMVNPFYFFGGLDLNPTVQSIVTTGNLYSFFVNLRNSGGASYSNIDGTLHYAIIEN